MGLKKDCFGVATVTSIGTLGFRDAAAPFTPMMRNLLIATVNQIVEKPVVRNGQIVIAPTFVLHFCTDHRFVDGGAIVKSNKVVCIMVI
jgi:pyruvate dehydrogenase E2 component (dihydrolipoamide acetyltransferase)